MINREDAGSVPCNAGIDSVHYICFFLNFSIISFRTLGSNLSYQTIAVSPMHRKQFGVMVKVLDS